MDPSTAGLCLDHQVVDTLLKADDVGPAAGSRGLDGQPVRLGDLVLERSRERL